MYSRIFVACVKLNRKSNNAKRHLSHRKLRYACFADPMNNHQKSQGGKARKMQKAPVYAKEASPMPCYAK